MTVYVAKLNQCNRPGIAPKATQTDFKEILIDLYLDTFESLDTIDTLVEHLEPALEIILSPDQDARLHYDIGPVILTAFLVFVHATTRQEQIEEREETRYIPICKRYVRIF